MLTSHVKPVEKKLLERLCNTFKVASHDETVRVRKLYGCIIQVSLPRQSEFITAFIRVIAKGQTQVMLLVAHGRFGDTLPYFMQVSSNGQDMKLLPSE